MKAKTFTARIQADSRTAGELAEHLTKRLDFPVSRRTVHNWRIGRLPPPWKQKVVLSAL
jgi:hypothetical protein